jgi:hypothetical protein
VVSILEAVRSRFPVVRAPFCYPSEHMKRVMASVVLGMLVATFGLAAASAPPESWIRIDFATGTCHYISRPMELTFSIPDGFVTRDPKHGPGVGCFWGTKEDLDRVLASPKGADYGKLQKGVFQAHLSTSSAYDPRNGKFADESQMLKSLAGFGITEGKVTLRRFGKYEGRVVTGKAKSGSNLYMLYLAPGIGANVLLINYRPATRPSSADAAVWTRFLDSIQPTE